MEVKKVKCPTCGVVLEVRNSKVEIFKIINCPQCGTKLRVRFEQVDNSVVDAKTFIAGMDGGGETIIAKTEPFDLKVFIVCEGKTYELHDGRNLVGRKASTSLADIQLEVEDRFMSRNNAVVNVIRTSDYFTVSIANHQNKNPIKVGTVALLDGDELVLSDGDEITMGTTKMTLKIG